MPPVELVSKIAIESLYLPFLEKLLAMLTACRARGAEYFAISGYRTDLEQLVLWKQGRVNPGIIVTSAGPGESAHNYGIACDFCRDGVIDRRGLQPDWRPESYVILGEEAKRLGLVWGGDFKKVDMPHVQWGPGLTTAKELEGLRAIKAVHGLSAVFDHLDELSEAK